MNTPNDNTVVAHNKAKKQITMKDIKDTFDRPIRDAAAHLGISCTKLKGICRKFQITRWPYRKVHSLTQYLGELEAKKQQAPAEEVADQLEKERSCVQKCIDLVYNSEQLVKNINRLKRNKACLEQTADLATDVAPAKKRRTTTSNGSRNSSRKSSRKQQQQRRRKEVVDSEEEDEDDEEEAGTNMEEDDEASDASEEESEITDELEEDDASSPQPAPTRQTRSRTKLLQQQTHQPQSTPESSPQQPTVSTHLQPTTSRSSSPQDHSITTTTSCSSNITTSRKQQPKPAPSSSTSPSSMERSSSTSVQSPSSSLGSLSSIVSLMAEELTASFEAVTKGKDFVYISSPALSPSSPSGITYPTRRPVKSSLAYILN